MALRKPFSRQMYQVSLAHLTALILFAGAQISHGYPEFTGDGYFSCTSCHVSTTGGDLVTAYGRSVAEEKLTMYSKEGEAKPFHGFAKVPEWLLLGGHYRHIQTNYEDSKIKEGRHFSMQQEVDLGVNYWKVWTYATTSFKRKENDPYAFDSSKPTISKWLLRFDATENVSLRLGKTMPKYGLNVPDHNAFVRKNVGLGEETERKLVELSYFSERFEVNIGTSVHALPSTEKDRELDDSDEKKTDELALNISSFWNEKHRVSVSGFTRKKDNIRTQSASLSTVLTMQAKFRLLAEINRMLVTNEQMTTNYINHYYKFWFNPKKGIFPYLLYEKQSESSDVSDSASDRIGFGASIHPRPHFELAGTISTRRNLKLFTYSNSANFVLHYWL